MATRRIPREQQRRPGRKPKSLVPEPLALIATLSGYGLTEAAIAHCLDLSPSAFLRRKTADPAIALALEKGKALAERQVGEALFVKAVGGDLGAICWWEKTRAGRVESKQVRHADADGNVMRFTLNLGAATVADTDADAA